MQEDLLCGWTWWSLTALLHQQEIWDCKKLQLQWSKWKWYLLNSNNLKCLIKCLFFHKEKSPDNSVRKRKPSESKDNDVDSSKSPESLRKGLLSQRRLRMLAHPMDSIKTDLG